MNTSEHNDDEAAVLEANAAFYRAFTRADLAAMRALWAEHAEVTCFHPGSALLSGRRSVLGAWQQILSEPAPKDMELCCHDPRVQLYGRIAIVTCYEGNGAQPAHLAATNIFVLEHERWKILHHQAGPLAQPRFSARTRASGLN